MVEKEKISIDSIAGIEVPERKPPVKPQKPEVIQPPRKPVGAEIQRRWATILEQKVVTPEEQTPVYAQPTKRPISDSDVTKLEGMLRQTDLNDQEDAASLEEGVANLRR